MKALFTFIFTIMLAITTFGQAEQNLVKNIPIEEAIVATLDLPGEVVVTEWDSKQIRIEMHVQVTNTNADVLKRLVMLGRYEVETVDDAEGVLIQMPKMTHHITIKGMDLEEKLRFEVMVPKDQVYKIVPHYPQNPMM